MEPAFAQTADTPSVSTSDATTSGTSSLGTDQSNIDNSTTPAPADTVTPDSTTVPDSSASPQPATTDSTNPPPSVGTDQSTSASAPSSDASAAPTSNPTGSPQTPVSKTPPSQNALTPSGSGSPNNSQLVANTSFSQDRLTIDKNTGALSTVFPIVIPPGRNNLQPDVDLTYNSQNTQFGSIFGEGWSVGIPYIQRLNKTGVDTLYSTSTPDYFTSSLDGELATTSVSSNYIARTDNGTFDKYTFSTSSDQWVMTDKNGTQYTFGSTSDSQQSDPNNSADVYTWMLKQVTDTNSNTITYSYFKDSGQIYPSSTLYTGNGSSTGIFEIDFLRASSTDNTVSSASGFMVTSNYRISEIDAKVSGTWVRKYALAYKVSDNGSSTLLSSITESGRDSLGTVTTLPAVTFSYQTQTPGWTTSSTWDPPVSFVNTFGGEDYGVRIADVYGDGLPDILVSSDNNGSTTADTAYINNGHGWTVSSTWDPPVTFVNTFNGVDEGARIVDLNGDGLPDIIKSSDYNGSTTVDVAYINDGHGWVASSTWDPPVSFFEQQNNTDNGAQIVDVNGDGLPDILQSSDISGSSTADVAYINNGHGWTLNSAWAPPVSFVEQTGPRETGVRIVDVNGDGLPDILQSNDFDGSSTVDVAYMNTGHGWSASTTWNPPVSFINTFGGEDNGVRLVDLDADGLPDILYSADYAGSSTVDTSYLNNDHGWTATSSWAPPVSFVNTETAGDEGARIVDVNGDGLPDILYSADYFGSSTADTAFINKNSIRADLLIGVTYAKGGSSTIAYKSATQYVDGSGNLLNKEPYPVYVVSAITNNDGSGNLSSVTYQYSGGSYYYDPTSFPYDKQFAGFSMVTATDSAGNVTKTYYHTGGGTDSAHGEYADDFWKIGKPYRVEQYDNAGHLYKKTINKWDIASLGSNAAFVKLDQTVVSAYDGLSTHDDLAEAYTFASTTGNETQKIQYGQVTGNDDGTFTDTGSDEYTTNFAYASSTTSSVIGKPSDVTILNQSSAKIKETQYYYDGLSLGSVSTGNATEEADWIANTTYATTENTYNGYGLVTQTLNPRNNTTTFAYDSFDLYPATTTNALSQTTGFLYDYSTGKTTQTIDPNNDVFQTVYDGLGRPLQIIQPDPNASSTAVTKIAYAYTDTANAVSVHETDYLNGSTITDTYSYYDGLGRLIQTRKSSQNSGTYKVTDLAYNNVNLLQQESLPYFASGSAKASATTTVALFTTYTYDPLQRVLTTANAVGTTTDTYGNWKVTITDPRGKPKDELNDAYGNLVQVNEYNSSSTYSTYYTYDGLQDLTNITDALGNVRNFTYDGLGERLTAQDLHASGDATYGTWNYTYDNAGNLTQTVDPKSQTVNYTYDALNRVSTEDYTGQAGTEFTYTYDSCTQGKTRLCTVSSTDDLVNDSYNSLGQLAQETDTIAGTAYTTSYAYDRQGNQLTITNPDNSEIAYTYNTAGLLQTVSQGPSGGTLVTVVSSFTYAPTDQPTVIDYENGVTQTNTYDAAHLYRLTQKVGALPGSGGNAQNISYTYDADGNITQLVDAGNAGTAKTVNYTYDDLSRLTAASTTVASSSPYAQSFTYDALGNITSGPAGTYSYNGTSSAYADPDAVTGISNSTTTTGGSTTSTPAFVQGGLDLDSSPVTLGSAVTSGDLVVVGITTNGQTIPTSTVSDNKGNTYTRVSLTENTSTADYGAIFYAKNVTGGSSFTVSTGISGRTLAVQEYSGVATSSPLDQSASTTGLSATALSPNVTTSIDHELYFGLAWSAGDGDTWTAGNGFTLREQNTNNATAERIATEDKVVTTATTTAAKFTVTTSDNWLAAIATFKPAVGASGSSTVTSTVSYVYDNNGNLLSSGNATNTWNYRNQLTQSVDAAGTSTYAYDYLGNRVKLVEGTTTTIFPTKFYNVTPGSATTSIEHIYGDGLLLATVQNSSSTSGGGGGSGTSTIALDATSTSITNGFNGGPITESWTHTITGTSPVLILMADLWQDVGGTGTVASATWKGVAFTKVRAALSGNMDSEIWYLAPTSTGAGTLSVTVTAATDAIKLGAASFTGAATSSPLDASSTATGTSGTPSASITTATSSDLVVATLSRYTTTNATTSRTSLFRDTSVSTLGAGSYQLATSSGSYSDTYSGSAADDWSMVMAAFKPGTTTGGSSSSTASTTIRYVLDDTLGGSSVVTDASGNVAEALDFYPYGQARIDTKTGSYVGEKKKFAGTELDALSGLNYAQARYQDPTRGQFLNEDPVFLAIGDTNELQQLGQQNQTSILMNPQSLNSYSYTIDNPITNEDPDGQYVELSGSVAIPGWSASAGLRFDQNGVDWFAGIGPGYGVDTGIGLGWAPNINLTHQAGSSVSANIQGADLVGAQISKKISGTDDEEDTDTGSPPIEVVIGGGYGGGVQAEVSGPIPFLTWGKSAGSHYTQQPSVSPSASSLYETYSPQEPISSVSSDNGQIYSASAPVLQQELSTLSNALTQLQSTVTFNQSKHNK